MSNLTKPNTDILLINPSQENIYGRGVRPPYPPLSLLSLGAVLRSKGYKVEVADLAVDHANEEQFISRVARSRPPVLGFTAVTPAFKSALRIARRLKRIYNPFILFGGVHVSATAEDAIRETCIDGIAIGEAEHTIIEFLENLRKGKTKAIDGMLIKGNGMVLRGGRRQFIEDLDELPFPAWSLLTHPERYSPPDALRTPVATIMTSRGCPYRCTFCFAPLMWGNRIRRRSVENVIDEIGVLVKEYSIREIHFADDDFSHDRDWTLRFLERIKGAFGDVRFYFMNGLRIDNIDEEMLCRMREARFINVGFGIESGCQRILNRVKKGLTIATITKNLRLAKQMGFKTWGFFIFGLPDETAETIDMTIDFSLALDPDFAKYLCLVPYPGTAVYEEYRSKGYLLTHDFDRYGIYSEPVFRVPSLSGKVIVRAIARAYLKFYLRPHKVLRILLKVRTLTELKLNFRALIFILRKIMLHQ
jgi:anaerobic magnesium-protoporphyrin IX monomethyl ester cyclase